MNRQNEMTDVVMRENKILLHEMMIKLLINSENASKCQTLFSLRDKKGKDERKW